MKAPHLHYKILGPQSVHTIQDQQPRRIHQCVKQVLRVNDRELHVKEDERLRQIVRNEHEIERFELPGRI